MKEVEVFTIAEVADQLKVSTRHIHRCIASGRLGCIRDGKIVRITHEQLAEFVTSLTVTAVPERGQPRQLSSLRRRRPILGSGHLTPL